MAIAVVETNKKELLKRAKRNMSLDDSNNELEIFYNLCVGRVFFRKSTNTLYFVDSPTISITKIIQAVFKGLNSQPKIQQLYMDIHGLFDAALKIELSAQQVHAVLVALRLKDIRIDIS